MTIKSKLTKEQKLDIVIEHLIGVIDGGYPGDYVWIGNTMVYTSSRGGAFSDLKNDSSLGVITKREMLNWFNRALIVCEEQGWDPEENVAGALYESAE